MSEYAFADYASLKASVADWLMRQDLTNQIPQFIAMNEAGLDSVLRVRKMIRRSTVAAENRYVTLPADWQKARNVQRLSDGEPLGFMAFDEIDKYRADVQAGRRVPGSQGPHYYSLVADSLELAPAPTPDAPADIEMIYYAKVPRLSDEEPTNWLLRDHPDVCLYGALLHSAPFLKDDERLAVWQSLYQQAVTAANQSDADARYSGAPMMRRGAGFGV